MTTSAMILITAAVTTASVMMRVVQTVPIQSLKAKRVRGQSFLFLETSIGIVTFMANIFLLTKMTLRPCPPTLCANQFKSKSFLFTNNIYSKNQNEEASIKEQHNQLSKLSYNLSPYTRCHICILLM